MSFNTKMQALQKTVRKMIDSGEFVPKTYSYSKPIPKLTPEKLKTRAKENGLKIKNPKLAKTAKTAKITIASQPIAENVSYTMPHKLVLPILSADELQATIQNAENQKTAILEKIQVLRDRAKLIYLSALVGKKPKNLSESVIDNLLQTKLTEYRIESRNGLSIKDSVFAFSDIQVEALQDIRLDMQSLSQQLRGLSVFLKRHKTHQASHNPSLKTRKTESTRAKNRKALESERAKLLTLAKIKERQLASQVASEAIRKGKTDKERLTRSAKIDNGLFYAIVRLANGDIRIESSSNDENKIAFSNISSCLKTVQLEHIIPRDSNGRAANNARYFQIMGIFRDFCPNGLIVESKPDVCIVQSKTVPTQWPSKPYRLAYKPTKQ